MTSHTPPKKAAKKFNWPTIIIACFVVLSVLAAVGFGLKNYTLQNEQISLQKGAQEQEAVIVQLKERKQVGERMRAKEILDKAEAYRKDWSEVVQDIQTELESGNKIVFESVDVKNDNQVSVQGRSSDLLATASLLLLVDRSNKFSDGFISNISPNSGDGSDPTYRFTATFNYLGNQSNES